ncbi:MAG: amidase [Pseudomonadota bacterium]
MSSDINEPILEVTGLRGGYGAIPILHGTEFSIEDGSIVGILGHNGMGKSTLLKTIMGYLPATAGRMVFDGETITELPVHERARLGLGYVPQGRGIFTQLSAIDNLRFAWSEETSDVPIDEAIDRILSEFPRLQPLLDRHAGALSGGEQQILAIARCLIAEPYLLLLDEPTEGIQPSIVDEIATTLKLLRDNRDITIVVVEQNLDFLIGLCDRLMIFERGEVKVDLATGETNAADLIDEFVGLGAGRVTREHSGSGSTPSRPSEHFSQDPTPPAAAAGKEAYMTVRRPTIQQMRDVASGLGITMGDDELNEYLTLMEANFEAYDLVDSMPDELPKVKYPRTPGHRPATHENPLNAWYVKSEVRGAVSGVLEGKTIALKDNVCLAGVPMMNGASTLEGYTPDVDATVVTRILDAGGTIVGKAHCEYFCLSGGSHTNATGPVHNPYKIGYSAGGSSSGSGALVGAGEVDMAIGGDQGGSIRIPASFCGCYGMKPTHGLVPYTGIMPIEPTIDHTGPITQTVSDNALMLEVIAGDDGLDPRQYAPRTDKYTQALSRGVGGMRIGVVRESFGLDNSEPDVDQKVREASRKLTSLGAVVEETSIPMHLQGPAIWTPIALEGLTDIMMHGNGFATGWKGLYVTSLLDAHSNWRTRADELSKSLKISMFVGEYMQKYYRGHFYAKAQNLSRRLRAAYDDSLAKFDLLLMPTLPVKATPLPPADAPLSLVVQRAFEMVANTAPFDATGHPAMSIPCGLSNGLPVGMMLIGRHYDESTIYRAAHAFEQAADWKSM